MTLSDYHQGYVGLSMDRVAYGLAAKEFQLKQVLNEINWQPSANVVKVAVLGCADKRFVPGHQEIFEKVFGSKVEITTFDITIEHLLGEKGVVQHDCTEPLPNQPYDFIFAHIILKFMPEDKQWLVVKNSLDALAPGGIALHFMDIGGKTKPSVMLKEGFYEIALDLFKSRLSPESFKEVIVRMESDTQRQGECFVLIKQKTTP